MYKKIIAAFCLVFLLQIEAKILETDKISDILSEVNDKTVVFLDIDDTLIVRKHMLGSTPWWINCQNFFTEHHINVDSFITPLYKIALNVPVCVVDEDAKDCISYIQDRSIPVFGLTARRRKISVAPDFDLATINELKQFGIVFSKVKKIKMPQYFEGILFTEGGLKGPVLEEFFSHMGKKYKKIVFVDDSWSQIRSVDACMKKAGISVVCYRFSGMDRINNSFNPYIANIQLQSMYEDQIMLSDEMAQRIGETLGETDPNYYLKYLFTQPQSLPSE